MQQGNTAFPAESLQAPKTPGPAKAKKGAQAPIGSPADMWLFQ